MLPKLIVSSQHRLLVDAFGAMLRDRYVVLAGVTDPSQLKKLVSHLAPDLVLAELSIHFLAGFDFLNRTFNKSQPVPRVVVRLVRGGRPRFRFEIVPCR